MLHHSPTRSRLRAIGQGIFWKLVRRMGRHCASHLHNASDWFWVAPMRIWRAKKGPGCAGTLLAPAALSKPAIGAPHVPSPDIRKGMPPTELTRDEFEQRFKSRFIDPAFAPVSEELQAITGVAWEAYADSRKAPHTRKAGPGFADPDDDLSVDWLAARDAIAQAQRIHEDPATPSRILIVNG